MVCGMVWNFVPYHIPNHHTIPYFTVCPFKASTLSSSLIFYSKNNLLKCYPIDRYNLSDAFYHKILLNVLENLDISKLKRGVSYLG